MEKLVQQILAYLSTIPRPKNWVLKLISFFFALFLWYFVAGEDKVDMTVSIPIEIVNLPRDLVVSNQFKKQLEVTVSGQRSFIRGLSLQHITRTVDLSNATPGKYDIENTPDSIPFPWGVSVLRLQPAKVTLLIDRLIEKTLIVKAVISGTPPRGFRLLSVVLDPQTISITGPQNILDGEKIINTDVIDISNLTDTTLKQVSLVLPPEISDLIGETVVTAHINIIEQMTEEQIPGVPIVLSKKDAEDYQLPEATITVRAEIPNTVEKNTEDLKTLFVATVDSNSPLPREDNEFPVLLSIAPSFDSYKDKIRILDYTPETIPLIAVETRKRMLEGRPLKIKVKED
jgi:YbbR domain-containing protein